MWLQCGVWGWRNLSAVDDVHDNCQAKHENDSDRKPGGCSCIFERAERSFDISQMVDALHLVCMQWRYWSFDNTKERREEEKKRLKILFGESYNFSEWMAVKRKQETRKKIKLINPWKERFTQRCIKNSFLSQNENEEERNIVIKAGRNWWFSMFSPRPIAIMLLLVIDNSSSFEQDEKKKNLGYHVEYRKTFPLSAIYKDERMCVGILIFLLLSGCVIRVNMRGRIVLMPEIIDAGPQHSFAHSIVIDPPDIINVLPIYGSDSLSLSKSAHFTWTDWRFISNTWSMDKTRPSMKKRVRRKERFLLLLSFFSSRLFSPLHCACVFVLALLHFTGWMSTKF